MRKALAFGLVVVTGACAAGLIVAEVGLRVAGYAHSSLYGHDQIRGWALRPGVAAWVSTEAGSKLVRTNSAGLRDREHAVEKSPGVVRIAVLGDSFAEALQVASEEAFWAVLERALGDCTALLDRRVEVINFGVGGYGTAQELLTWREQVWRYAPDLVLLAFYTENDVLNNSRVLNPTRPDDSPYFVYQGDRLVRQDRLAGAGPLARAYHRASGWVADTGTRLRLVQLLHAASRAWTQRAQRDAQEKRLADLGLSDIEAAPYVAPAHPALTEAWRVTEGLILTLKDDVRAHGATLWIVTLSNSPQVHPDLAARRGFMSRVGVADLFYPDRRIAQLGERAGIPVITLAPAFAEHAERHRRFLHGFPAGVLGVGHWNAEGHHLAGTLIADRLCADSASKLRSR